jgi:hypothetical protein
MTYRNFFSKDEDVGSNSDLSDVIDEPVAPREKAAGARRAAAAAAVSLLTLFLCCSCRQCCGSETVGIPMFLVLLDPDPLVRGMDPDPSIIEQK